MDRFLIDETHFISIFQTVYAFGKSTSIFAPLCFCLLSRKDKNEGMIDFSQFITLYKIILTADCKIKLCLIYQMSFYHKIDEKTNKELENSQNDNSSSFPRY